MDPVRDCNTCAEHVQGRSIDDVPEVCRQCMRVTTQGLEHLPFWKPHAAHQTLNALMKPDWLVEEQEEQQQGNPKDRVSGGKPRLDLPTPAKIAAAQALADGARKYGAYNWRDEPIRASVYIQALERHLELLKNGEDYAEDSGCHHLGHLMAGAALWLDAQEHGQLIDDRKRSPEAVAALKRAYAWFDIFVKKLTPEERERYNQ